MGLCWVVSWHLVLVGFGAKVYLDQGVMLREHGKIYVDVNDRFISLFKKVALPNLVFKHMPLSCHVDSSYLACEGVEASEGDTVDLCPPDKFSVAIKSKRKVRSMTKERISLFDSLAGLKLSEGYVDTHRSRRGILSMLGLGTGILSMIFSGVTVHKLSAHVKALKDDFTNFKRLELEREERVASVVNHNFQVLDYRYRELESNVANIKCETYFALALILESNIFSSWQRELDTLFSHVAEGNLGGKLTSKILPERDLLLLLKDHPELSGTAYASNIMNFYLTSNVVLVSAELDDQDFLILHYVLVVPIIYPFRAFDLHQVDVVPIHHEGVCLKTKLPGFMFNQSGNLVGIGSSCKIGELVSLCYERIPDSPSFANNCLGEAVNCSFDVVSCSPTRYAYDFSGILIGGKPGDELFTLTREEVPGENEISNIGFSKYGVKFVPWSEARYVQYKGVRIESPEGIISEVTTHSPNYTVEWEETVKQGKLDALSAGTLEALSILGIDSENLDKAQSVWTGPVFLAITLGAIGCAIGLINCQWDRFCRLTRSCKNLLVSFCNKEGREGAHEDSALELRSSISDGANPI